MENQNLNLLDHCAKSKKYLHQLYILKVFHTFLKQIEQDNKRTTSH